MFFEATIEKLTENGIEVQTYDGGVDGVEVALQTENGAITYLPDENTFEIGSFMFWENNQYEDLKKMAEILKESLALEEKTMLIKISAAEEEQTDLIFLNTDNEELIKTAEHIKNTYVTDGSYILKRKDENNKLWHSSEEEIFDNKILISFDPEKQKMFVEMWSANDEIKIRINEIVEGKDIFEILWENIKVQVENKLMRDGHSEYEVTIAPFGFRINLKGMIFDFEIKRRQGEKILLILNEFVEEPDYSFHTISTDFFQEFSNDIFIKFENGKAVFEDNGFFKELQKKRLTSFFSYE